MQRANLRTGLLAGVAVLALGACSFHHRDDRSDNASTQPRVEQQGSSQQAAANYQPAQGAYATGGTATPSGNGYAARGAANADTGYADRGSSLPRSGAAATAPTRAGTPYADDSPYANGNTQGGGRSSATQPQPSYADGAQDMSGSSYPKNAPSNGSTAAGGSPYANGAPAAGSTGMSGSGSTVAPAQRSPAAMNDATSPNGVQGDTPTAARGGMAGTGAPSANGAQQGRGTTSPTAAQGAAATAAPQPLVQNNTRNQMQNQLQSQTGLVDVNLNNVKLDVAKNLNIDASKIPVTVQLPVTAAANVCGVDVNALAAQKQQGGGAPTCMANNANEATQAVQTSVQ